MSRTCMNCAHSEFLRVEQTGKKERIQLTCTNRNSGEYGDWVTPADSCMQWKEEDDGPDQTAGSD